MAYLFNPLALKRLVSMGVDVTGYDSRMLTHDWMAGQLETALTDDSWKQVKAPFEDGKLEDPVPSNGKRKKKTMIEYQTQESGDDE